LTEWLEQWWLKRDQSREAVQAAEPGRYDQKEVADYDALCVIPNEGHPTLFEERKAHPHRATDAVRFRDVRSAQAL
jgi:hypothetical protein